MLVSEFSGMLSTLDGAQRKSVDTAFRSRTGRTLAAFDARGTARLARILARGVIRGEEQYYFVRESLEVAGLDSARTDEVAKIEALLLDYENKIEKTLAKRRSPPRAD